MRAMIVWMSRQIGRGPGQLQSELLLPLLLIVGFVGIGAVRQGGGSALAVVNIVPKALSGDADANHEPFLAVHPTNPSIIVATAHNVARGFCKADTHAPLLLSVNEGRKWWVVCAASAMEKQNIQDGSVQFSGDGTALFAGTLQWRPAEKNDLTTDDVVDAYVMGLRASDLPAANWSNILDALSTWPDPMDETPMTVLAKSKHTDQPVLGAATRGDRQVVAVGANAFHEWFDPPQSICRSGVVMLSTAPFDKGFTTHCVATRESVGPTPAVRTAVHEDGTVYGVFYRPVLNGQNVDVVVVRADNDALNSATPFAALEDVPDPDADASAAGTTSADCDRRDGKPGIRVARCVRNSFDPFANPAFGQERRVQSQLSVAVHPTESGRVYIAWADNVPGANPPRLRLHVQYSNDRGKTWSDPEGAVIMNATNPALAVADDGVVGLLHQRLAGSTCPGGSVRWKTQLDLFDASLVAVGSRPFGSMAACAPPPAGVPYLGDYLKLQAVGNSFFGVFSGSNDLATTEFPVGKSFQRKHSGTVLKDGSGNNVSVSIDPYFFRFRR